jgi:hypothetical protein
MKNDIKDTLKAAHEALEQMMSKRHYNTYYRNQPGYPGDVAGVWVILNKKPSADVNCAVVYEAGVWMSSYPDFEEGFSRRAEEEIELQKYLTKKK